MSIKLISLLEETINSQMTIFCDLDGVLVDFDKGYEALTGVQTNHASNQGNQHFWNLYRDSLKNKEISARDYWENLPWMPDGPKLWNYISKYNPYVLTAPAVDFTIPKPERYKVSHNESMQGKTEWVKRLDNMKKIYFAASSFKQQYSGKNKILIDDRKSTIDAWNSKGGIGIFHTSSDNTIKQLQELSL
tara:strand:- start:38 stop:607 length:570 start_codon:yes stop_codon:yes gene_type:complete